MIKFYTAIAGLLLLTACAEKTSNYEVCNTDNCGDVVNIQIVNE